MAHAFPVNVKWAEWKGISLPSSGWYSTLARFPGDDERVERWSVTVKFSGDQPREVGSTWRGIASFLSEDAPHDFVREGVVFELREGDRASATVTILNE